MHVGRNSLSPGAQGFPHVTMVRKIAADGQPCRKCLQVETRLREQGYTGRIARVLSADERDPQSPGRRWAQRLGVETAPFFVVRDADGAERVYTSYLRLVKEVFRGVPSEAEEARELAEHIPGLDHL